MKNLKLFLKFTLGLILIMTTFQGCTSQDNKKPLTETEKKIQEYYKEKLNDPNSYEPIKTDVLYTTNITKVVKHSYRAKNSYNAIIKQNSYFIIAGTATLIEIDEYICSIFRNLIKKEVNSDYGSDPFFARLGTSRVELQSLIDAGGKRKSDAINELFSYITNYKYPSELEDILTKYYGANYVLLFKFISYTPKEMAIILSDNY